MTGDEWNELVAVLLLPVVHQGLQLVVRELVFSLVLGRQRVEELDLLLDDPFTLAEILDLEVQLVHVILVLKDAVLVNVPHLELEVL